MQRIARVLLALTYLCCALVSATAEARARRELPCQPLPKLQPGDVDGDGRPDRFSACRATRTGDGRGRCAAVRLELSHDGSKHELARRCEGSKGVRGGGDELRLDGPRLQQVRSGGSAWAWQATCTLDLRHRRVLRLVQKAWWSVEPQQHRQTSTSDFQRGLVKVEWTAPRCHSRLLFHGAFAPIPSTTLATEPRWNPTAHHDRGCVLRLSEAGHALPLASKPRSRGKAGGHHVGHRGVGAVYRGPQDAEVRLWAVDVAGRSLLLRGTITDDRLTRADRLHLWLGRSPFGYMEPCVRRSAVDHFATESLLSSGRERVLALRIPGVAVDVAIPGVSGRMRQIAGGLAFELRLGTKRRRQALRFGLAVGFADADGTSKAARYLLSTARLDPRRPTALGELGEAYCSWKRGRLQAQTLRSCGALLP